VRAILGGLVFGSAGVVLATRRIGIGNWQLWAILGLLLCAEFVGAMA
jgi:hypothetical protein